MQSTKMYELCPNTIEVMWVIPGGLVVRIRRSHRRGPGSIPGQGSLCVRAICGDCPLGKAYPLREQFVIDQNVQMPISAMSLTLNA